MENNTKVLMEKWSPVVNYSSDNTPAIKDNHKKWVTAVVLENTEKELQLMAEHNMSTSLISESAAPTNLNAGVAKYDPVTIALIRRAMPNLIAYDIAGVQPMTGPVGLIFAMRSLYNNQAGSEAFYGEANTGHSTVGQGNNSNLGQANTNLGTIGGAGVNFAGGVNTATLEALGSDTGSAFKEMGFTIEKMAIEAKGRALAGSYSIEMAQDLRAIHGLDAETELANMLSTELLADINRELVRSIYATSKVGCASGTTTVGTFNMQADSDGRWSVEQIKGLILRIGYEANEVAKSTRRGRGNLIICSSNVATALSSAGVLDYNPALLQNQMQVDDTGNTFVGILSNQFRVYIDPYATVDFVVVGYKGADPKDAGIFYCPYVPMQMARVTDPNTFQPKIGFKTRYGLVANPFAEGLTKGNGALNVDSNVYYRRFLVTGLL